MEQESVSHLLQMRGLKQKQTVGRTSCKVASFTDAWIETLFFWQCFMLA